MKRSLLLTFLLLVLPANAQHLDNYHIEAMKARYHQTGPASAHPSRGLPDGYLERRYERPVFKPWLLPYENWEADYRKYFREHYGDDSLTFEPELIVMHYTVTDSATRVWNYFKRTQVSVQLMVDKDGTIYRLMPLTRRCNGAYGVNHKALSIEMVATTEDDLLSRPDQVFASFCLVRRLMERYDIPLSKVYAHYEVSTGRSAVPEYLDLKDKVYPDRYPPSSARSDPGPTYMSWLRTWLRRQGV